MSSIAIPDFEVFSDLEPSTGIRDKVHQKSLQINGLVSLYK